MIEFTKEEIQDWIDNPHPATLMSKEERELRFKYFKEVGLITWVKPGYGDKHYEEWLKKYNENNK